MFALNRRKAWQGAIVEASAWDFDITSLSFMGQIVLPAGPNSSSFTYPTLFQFADEGATLIYANAQGFCRLSLSTPYDILTADISNPVKSGNNVYQGNISSAQFSPDGRTVLCFCNAAGNNNFRYLPLEVAFDPISKVAGDLVVKTPPRSVTGSNNCQFSADGLNLYLCPMNGNAAELHQFVMRDPFDVTTLSMSTRVISLANVLGLSSLSISNFAFAPDGIRFVTCSGTRLRMWSLQQPWDIRYVTHVGYIDLSSNEAPGIQRVDVDPTASYFYVFSSTTSVKMMVQYAINRS